MVSKKQRAKNLKWRKGEQYNDNVAFNHDKQKVIKKTWLESSVVLVKQV